MPTIDWLRRFLSPPVFEEAEKTRLARVTYLLPVSMLLPAFLTTIAVSIFSSTPVSSSTILSVILIFMLIGIILVRLGSVQLASWLLLLSVWGLVAIAFLLSGGVLFPVVGAFLLIVLAAGQIRGGRVGFVFAVLSALLGVAVTYGGTHDLLPPAIITYTHTETWVLYVLYLFGAAALLAVGNDALIRALKQAEHSTKAFQKSEARFRKVVEASPGHVFLLNRQGQVLVMHPSRSREVVDALATSSIYDGLWESDRPIFQKEVDISFTQGTVRQFTIRGIDQPFTYQVWLSPVKRLGGSVDYLIGNMYVLSSPE
ncbi:hypothetical protein ACFL45_09890 [Candidatus Neomarinimicrobiota bacterium]